MLVDVVVVVVVAADVVAGDERHKSRSTCRKQRWNSGIEGR